MMLGAMLGARCAMLNANAIALCRESYTSSTLSNNEARQRGRVSESGNSMPHFPNLSPPNLKSPPSSPRSHAPVLCVNTPVTGSSPLHAAIAIRRALRQESQSCHRSLARIRRRRTPPPRTVLPEHELMRLEARDRPLGSPPPPPPAPPTTALLSAARPGKPGLAHAPRGERIKHDPVKALHAESPVTVATTTASFRSHGPTYLTPSRGCMYLHSTWRRAGGPTRESA